MKIRFLLLVLLLAASFALVTPAFALQDPAPQSPTIEFLVQLLFGLAVTAPGATALGVVLVNLGKAAGWIQDGTTQVALNVLNVLFALVIGLASLFTTWDIPGLDTQFSEFAGVLTVLLPALMLIYKWLAPLFYSAVRGFPLLGYSHTLAKK